MGWLRMDEQYLEDIKKQLTNEFAKQLIALSYTSKEECRNFLDDSDKQNDEIVKWHQHMQKSNQAINGLGEVSTFFYASMFLSAYETYYVATLDRICYLYIKNGHDLYDFFNRKFAKDFEDIGKISTNIKFLFLKEHGLEFLIRESDNLLRNKIAHLDFTIEAEGKIRVQTK